MVATTGSRLLPVEALESLRTLLLPQAFIVTPNIPEALLLSSSPDTSHATTQASITDVEDLVALARKVKALGPQWVLVKGGHAPFRKDGTRASSDDDGISSSSSSKEIVVDILLGPSGEVTRFTNEYQDSRNTHGTGCSLASAIASNLALGQQPVDAVGAAIRYIEAGIRTAPGYGRGNGPLNHFHSVHTLPFAPYVLSLPLLFFRPRPRSQYLSRCRGKKEERRGLLRLAAYLYRQRDSSGIGYRD